MSFGAVHLAFYPCSTRGASACAARAAGYFGEGELNTNALHGLGAARAYGCLSTSFSRLERDIRRRGAFSLYWDSNAFALGGYFVILTQLSLHAKIILNENLNEILEKNHGNQKNRQIPLGSPENRRHARTRDYLRN
jgi:hypothetical protein